MFDDQLFQLGQISILDRFHHFPMVKQKF